MNRFLKLSTSLLLLLPALVFGQNSEKRATVLGTVLNGSQDSTSLAGQEVVLYKIVNGQEADAPRPHAVTDVQGHFFFADLEIDDHIAYYPLTVFVGVEFSGQAVQPTVDARRQRSDIVLFEPTVSDSAISTTQHHLLVQPGVGAIAVRELFLFNNRDNHTYIGHAPANDKEKIVLEFATPAQATELQFGGDLMSCCAVVDGNRVFDTMPFKPGTRQEVLTYTLPYQGETASLVKTVAHPTETFDIFLPDPLRLQGFAVQKAGQPQEIAAESAAGEPFRIRDQDYTRYHAAALTPGSLLSLSITNLPAAPSRFVRSWLAPLALTTIVLLGFLLHRQRRRSAKKSKTEMPASEVSSIRRQLLDEILELDEQFEAGRIEAASYHGTRERLAEAILALETDRLRNAEISSIQKRKSAP